jgi:hypothetical protein
MALIDAVGMPIHRRPRRIYARVLRQERAVRRELMQRLEGV